MFKTSFTFPLSVLLLCAAPIFANAAATSSSTISDEPLGTGTGVSISPNVYFVFDNSGSMKYEYLPDSVPNKNCFGASKVLYGNLSASSGSIHSSTSNDIAACALSDPPYNAPSYNFIAYDPSISYLPATDYDGTNTVYISMTSAATSGWTAVPVDEFGVLSNFKDRFNTTIPSPTNLVTGYPDTKWCNGSSTTDCRINALGYQYPDLVKYTTAKSTTGPAYYYTMSPSFYCTDYTGTSCQSTADSTHTQAFPYLWCTNFTASSQTYSGCQSLQDSTHVVPTLLGNTITQTAATATGGSITVSAAASFNGSQLYGFTVAGTSLFDPSLTMPITYGSSDTAHLVAADICTKIHAYSATSGFDCPTAPAGTNATAVLTTTGGAASNGAVVQAYSGGTHTYTHAVGSFQVGTPVNATMKTNSILVGSTQLLATAVTATASQSGTAAALCAGINANTVSSQYRARVVSTLGSASPTWGSGTACTSVTGSYVEIQSLINNVAENGKVISVSGPAAASAQAAISILGNKFTAGTRPGNLGTITAFATTLFNSIPVADTTTVSNSNSQSIIDAGLRSKWASATGYSIGGTSGNIIVTAPAGSAYNGTVTVNAGTSPGFSGATTSITFAATAKNKTLTGLTCGGTDVITAASYSTGSSSTSSTWPIALATAITGRGINGYTVTCPAGGKICNITAPTSTSSCTVIVKSGTSGNISITGGTFTAGSAATSDDLSAAITASPFTGGTDGAIPTSGLTALAGFTDTVTGAVTTTTTPFTGGKDSSQRTKVGIFNRVDIINDGRTFVKASGRTDCAGGTCTYDEEMTNFANWYAYYRTRCDMMKTGIFRSFAPLGSDFRVGFNDIYDNSHLDMKDFNSTNKQAWYAQIKGMSCSVMGTPLQKGLSTAGRYYAGKVHTTTDPIQYTCQKNFTILSTDGYWNDMAGTATAMAIDANGTTIGNVDSTAGINSVNVSPNSPKAAYRDANATAGTLADVAKWYYDHDLRNGSDSVNDAAHGWGDNTVTTDAHYSNVDVHATTDDPATWQHMVTFTLGLGMDGLLHYDPNYKTGGSADYEAVKKDDGTKTWGVPGPDKQQNVDDLWHAAVNGHGQYFSARNPEQLVTSLNTALTSIAGVIGAASASATSNMEPVAGDNYLYAASYKTQEWTGDMQSKNISLAASNAGQVSTATNWSAQALLDSRDLVSSPRVILTYNSSGTGTNGKAKTFAWANLTTAEKAYFNITSMSNYVAGGTVPVAANCNTAASGTSPTACSSLLDYLTGSYTGGASAFRARTHILGDSVDTQPVFVGAPAFLYSDTGYLSFSPTRSKMIYVSANDGMLHAFDGDGLTGGAEKWAYVPSFVLPNLWNLADVDYANHHQYFVDGPLTAGDVYINSAWSTVLVGGLGKGGNGYFALDVTDPTTPKVLWEFTDAKMGYTYGNPLITKLDDGTWVAIVTSGYDNVPSTLGNAPSGDGKGHIYVIDMASGTLLYRIDTGDGSTTNPSNLGRINNWVSDSVHDNTTLYLYVGDMHGNLWRATLPLTTPSAGTVLSGSSTILDIFTAPTGQMITVRPELGSKDGSDDHRMILFGTGRYLSTDDKIDQTQQSIYGIYDDTLVTSTTPVTQSSLVQQTLCGQGISPNPAACTMTPLPTTYRTTTTNTANLGLGTGQVRGWYVNLPDVSSVGGSERVNIDPILQQGTLTVASNVPTSSDCNTGGYSWLYFLDYLTGSFTATSGGSAGVKINNSMVVGISEVFIDGTGHIESTNADSSHIDTKVPPPPPPGSIKRVGWRELFSE